MTTSATPISAQMSQIAAHSGRVAFINVNPAGGVPKRPVRAAAIDETGVDGDRQADTRHHGGPTRAVCLLGGEVIDALRAEGHPIGPGTTGENLTLQGLDWTLLAPGVRLKFVGGVVLEITSYAAPCSTIRDSFLNGEMNRIKHELHPGWSRLYARTVTPGVVHVGEEVRICSQTSGQSSPETSD